MFIYAIIYLITCLVNNKVYVGFTTQPLEKRFKRHISDSKSKSPKCLLHKAIKKYGVENFNIKILAKSPNVEYCREVLELYYIKQYNSYIHTEESNGYNMTKGGEGMRGHVTSEETKELLRQSSKRIPRNPLSNEAKEHMRQVNLAKNTGIGHTFAYEGKILTFNSLVLFCKENDLNNHCMRKVERGIQKEHKGYSLPHKPDTIKSKGGTFRFIFNNKIIEIFNLREFCRNMNLNYNSMFRLSKGINKNYKGYSRYIP